MVRRKTEQVPIQTNRPPAVTSDDREIQLISAAVDLAEQQILAGTASSQVIVHYLKLGSSRERLEQTKLRNETDLLITKKELMESEARTESLIRDALEAMKSYSGNTSSTSESDDDDFDY